MNAERLRLSPGDWVTLPAMPDGSACGHEFDAEMIGAVNAAIAAGRPLLVRGEPGLGKTQLAQAAAAALKRAYLACVVDSRTDHRDLLWRFDAIRRLAAAQLVQLAGTSRAPGDGGPGAFARDLLSTLAEHRFVRPGPLWWALNWTSALQALQDSSDNPGDSENPLLEGGNDNFKQNGWVLLIDEIDKAESDLPNGLLEVLGLQRFTPYGTSRPVAAQGRQPLVIITTNEDRVLPAPFLRRCLVLTLQMPGEDDAIAMMVRRGEKLYGARTHPEILARAARQLWEDRSKTKPRPGCPLPGQAEYLDLIRILVNLHDGDIAGQAALLESASKYVFRKRVDA